MFVYVIYKRPLEKELFYKAWKDFFAKTKTRCLVIVAYKLVIVQVNNLFMLSN